MAAVIHVIAAVREVKFGEIRKSYVSFVSVQIYLTAVVYFAVKRCFFNI